MPARRPSVPPRPVPAAASAEPLARALFVALALGLAARLAAMAWSTNWLWGVDGFRARPAPEAFALAALALAGWLPPVARVVERGSAWLGEAWMRGGRLADLVASVAGGAALAALRDPLRFPGDAAMRLGMLGTIKLSPALVAQAYPLDRLLNLELPRALRSAGMSDEAALQRVGAVVGAVFLFAGIRFVRACGARGSALPAGALALAGGALVVHFAGYDKFGPLMVGLVLAALGTVQLARTGRGVWTLALGATIAALAHRSAYLLVPALAWTLFRAHRSAVGGRARAEVLGAAAVVVAAFALMFPRTLDLALHFDRNVHLPGGTVARARADHGALDALVRVSNALNALAYLVPLSWMGAAAAWGVWRARARHGAPRPGARFSVAPAAALAIGGFMLLLLGVEPGGGWARDWDVATGAGTLVACLTAGALVESWQGRGARATLGPAVTFALAVLASTWWLHVDGAAARGRLMRLLEARPAWSAATRTQAYDFLGTRSFNDGDPDRAARLFDQAVECGGPNPRLLYQAGLAYMQSRRLEEAAERFRQTVAVSPVHAQAWSRLGYLTMGAGDPVRAEAYVDSALAHDPALPSALEQKKFFIRSRAGTP